MNAFTPLKKYRAKVLIAPLFKLIECLCEIAVPFFVRAIIDSCFDAANPDPKDLGFALGMGGVVLLLAFVGFAFTMITQYLAARVAADYGYDLKATLHDHLLALSPKQIDAYGKEKALNLLGSDAFALGNGVQHFMRLLVRAPFLTIGCLAAAFFINVYAGIVIATALLICALALGIYMKKAPEKYQRLQEELDRLSTSGGDLIRGVRVIHGFNAEEREIAAFSKQSDHYRKVATAIWRFTSFVNPITFAFINLALIGVLFLGSYSFSSTGLSVGSMVALISLLTQALAALLQFSLLANNLTKAIASKHRIDAFLALPLLIQDGPIQEEAPMEVGQTLFAFHDAELSFGGDRPVLSHLNLEIKKGERIGIIGGTGAGKSTFLALLCRYLDVTHGEITFKGHPIQDGTLANLRSSIAMVGQQGGLFQGSIRDNLCLGLPFSETEINAALEGAQAASFVQAYVDGLDHPLTEMGNNLSGGQRQRLLIARNLLHHREISIYDDATSALDYATEAKVRQAIFARSGDTILFVSRRVTSVMGCDCIYVFDNGEIVGEGDHESLLKGCPVYAETYQAQVARR